MQTRFRIVSLGVANDPEKFVVEGRICLEGQDHAWTALAHFRPPYTASDQGERFEWLVFVLQDRNVTPVRYPPLPNGMKTLVEVALAVWLKEQTYKQEAAVALPQLGRLPLPVWLNIAVTAET